MPFMVVLSIHLSLSLLLISAQFFVEPPSHAPPVQWRKVYIYIYSFLPTYITKLCNFVLRELAGWASLEAYCLCHCHPLVQTADWQGTVCDWSVVCFPLRCRCAETVVLNYPLHCWLVTLPPQEFDSTNMPGLFVFTSWTVSESATRMPPAGGQPFFSAYQPPHLCSLGSFGGIFSVVSVRTCTS